MRGWYALWCLILVASAASAVPVVLAEEYEGTIDTHNPSTIFTIPAHNGELITITPIIEPRGIGGEYHLRLEKEKGIVIREWSGSISRLRFRTDSERLKLEYSPIRLNGSFQLIVTSTDAATVTAVIDRKPAGDANQQRDVDDETKDPLIISTGTIEGHIAGPLERESTIPFTTDTTYIDETDWYELIAPAAEKKYFIDLGPQQRGLYAISVTSPDGMRIFNQSSIYPYERIQFTLEDDGYGRFFVEIGSPNSSGGGYYSLDITEHDENETLEVIAHARSVLISPLKTIATEENPWNRFWHVMIIAILGMMAVAMLSAYHFGKRVPARRSARNTSEYIKQALESGYSSEQIETSLRAYGYSDAMIKQGFEKIR